MVCRYTARVRQELLRGLNGMALVQLSQRTWYLATTRVFLQDSVENLAATRPDELFIVDAAFTMWNTKLHAIPLPLRCHQVPWFTAKAMQDLG